MSNRRFLAVDQGNSFCKLSLFEDETPLEICRIPTEDSESVFSVVESWHPDCGAFCSVGHIDPRLVESLRIAVGGHFLLLSHSTPLPINIEYATPDTLGLDRVALAAGAASLYPGQNIMVVDAGTAVTLDVVMSSPSSLKSTKTPTSPKTMTTMTTMKTLTTTSFLGGRISPGLLLRLEALNGHTAALPLISADGPMPVAGYSTETSIRSGVIGGLANEIVATFREYNDAFGCSRLAFTGGDAGILYKLISSRIPADHVPDLMARGLLYIYNHNENL